MKRREFLQFAFTSPILLLPPKGPPTLLEEKTEETEDEKKLRLLLEDLWELLDPDQKYFVEAELRVYLDSSLDLLNAYTERDLFDWEWVLRAPEARTAVMWAAVSHGARHWLQYLKHWQDQPNYVEGEARTYKELADRGERVFDFLLLETFEWGEPSRGSIVGRVS